MAKLFRLKWVPHEYSIEFLPLKPSEIEITVRNLHRSRIKLRIVELDMLVIHSYNHYRMISRQIPIRQVTSFYKNNAGAILR